MVTKSSAHRVSRRIAAEMLKRPLVKGEVVWHRDRNSCNVSPDNLEVISREEYYRRLRDVSGNRRRKVCAKLTRKQVAGIKHRFQLAENGVFNDSFEAIARDFGVPVKTIRQIRNGKIHSDVTAEELEGTTHRHEWRAPRTLRKEKK